MLVIQGSGVKLVGKSFVFPGISPELDHGTWRKRLTGGFLITDGAPSFKLVK